MAANSDPTDNEVISSLKKQGGGGKALKQHWQSGLSMMRGPGICITVLQMAESQELEESYEIFLIDLTDDVENDKISELEVEKDFEGVNKLFENVSKDKLVVVLSRISNHACNIPEEALIAEKVLEKIDDLEPDIIFMLRTICTLFFSFHNVQMKAKQVRSVRIEQNFLKDSPKRDKIKNEWEKLITLSRFYPNKSSTSVLEHQSGCNTIGQNLFEHKP